MVTLSAQRRTDKTMAMADLVTLTTKIRDLLEWRISVIQRALSAGATLAEVTKAMADADRRP